MKIAPSVLHEYLSIGAHDDYDGEKWIYPTYLDNLQELHEDENPHLPEEQFYELQKLDIRQICVAAEMSNDHIGGDDVVSYVKSALRAVEDGYEVLVWYGPKTEVLIIGVRPGDIELENE